MIIFQEPFLHTSEKRSLELPRGHEMVAMSRPDSPGLKTVWGGVAIVIRTGIQYKSCAKILAPDYLDLARMDSIQLCASRTQ
jgi:hypothetical protein